MPKQNEHKPANPPVSGKTTRRDVATLEHSMFLAQMGTEFAFQLQPPTVVGLELIEVSELKKSKRQERFSLVFRGPLAMPMGQGRYEVEHAELGTFELFIVPIARDERGFSYEAVFNRLLKLEE